MNQISKSVGLSQYNSYRSGFLSISFGNKDKQSPITLNPKNNDPISYALDNIRANQEMKKKDRKRRKAEAEQLEACIEMEKSKPRSGPFITEEQARAERKEVNKLTRSSRMNWRQALVFTITCGLCRPED